MQQSKKNYRRIVVKIGSSLLCESGKALDLRFLQDIVSQVSRLVKGGNEVAIVSSGAIALGMSALGLKERPKKLHELQAAAAVGQNELMDTYRDLFNKCPGDKKLLAAQVLLTWEDFNERARYLNAKNTLVSLFSRGIVPVVNENDTVSVDEIRFGDNDRLSALVASLISADLLVILSDVDGLLAGDRKTVVRIVDEITPEIKRLARPTDKKTCVGGMITKLEAAKIAVDSGIPCVIANGRARDVITSAMKEPAACATLFLPKEGMGARRRWIAFGTRPRGKVVVDEGARKALIARKSLLAVGITGTDGVFESGDVVGIVDAGGAEFARGKVSVSSKQLEKVRGGKFSREIIHCDNIVIL